MLKVTPNTMESGNVTAIQINDDGLHEVMKITPISFDIFNEDKTKKVISRYYLKKKTCENLIQQLEMAQSEFEEASAEFESLTHTPAPEPEQVPEVEKEIYIKPPEPKESKKIRILPPEPSPPEPEPVVEFKSEPVTISESIESTPAPAPLSLEEITTKTIESDELKDLIANNQLSDATIREVILKVSPPEWEETVHGMVIAQLKEKEIIEPSLFEKITKKVRGRPKK